MVESHRIVYPDNVLLRPDRAKWVRLIILAAVFTMGGWWMISDEAAGGWLVLIFFGACLVVGIVNCLPGASGLVVMREGFGLRTLFRTRFYPWGNIEGFGVYNLRNHGMKGRGMVGFNAQGDSRRRGAVLSTVWVGFNSGLPETYGLSAEKLAAAMNAYLKAATGREM